MKKTLIAFLMGLLLLLSGCSKKIDTPLQVQLMTEAGIEITIGESAEPKNLKWLTTVTETNFYEFYVKKYKDFAFQQLTSQNGKDFFTIGFDALAQTSQGYLEIPIHFRSNTTSVIDISNVNIQSTSRTFVSDVEFTNSKGDIVSLGENFEIEISNAIRISFDNGSSVIAFEKPSTSTNTVLGLRSNESLSSLNGVFDYYQKKNNNPFPVIDNVSVIETITNNSDVQIITLFADTNNISGANFYGIVIMRIWIEGYDPDAYNHILDDKSLTISARFSGK